jgi:hypothetical protein
MLFLALSPPLPFVGKLVVTLVMLTLAGMLIRDAGGSLTRQSIAVAVGASLMIVIVLETAPLPKYFRGLHEPSVLVAGIVGVLCGAILLRPTSSAPKRQRASGPLSLFLLACVGGPLFGLVWAYLTILLTNVSPMDLGYTYSVNVGIGMIAGVFGGVMLVVASLPNR